MIACTLALTILVMTAADDHLPTVELTADNLEITSSCRVVIPSGKIVADADGNGVIHVKASDVVIEFVDGSVLRGSPRDCPPDEYRGYGIRIDGQRNVTLRNMRINGFWCAVWATAADGLTLEQIDASDNRRARLKSTPAAEDGTDWLFPHSNDNHEWLNKYGAAIYVERSRDVTVRDCKVWHGQNGLILDRVSEARVYDNDFSFNSGWGVALWRSSRNVISRNAIDFCVRGYSHGVYNRGQDSAGILMFEQCSENVIAENSVTHGGDGFFGFAGREALGEGEQHPVEWYRRRGNNDNLLIRNDFSYAPAHGIEMTFSFGNRFIANRLVENAICGVWGGYSQETLIAGNQFSGNGQMGYGLERGGVNIEHGKHNRIVHNTFEGEKCGVHLWWDPDEGFAVKPWAKANGVESTDNLIADNRFANEELVFHFRGDSQVTIGANQIVDCREELKADPQARVERKPDLHADPLEVPDYPVFGEKRPVGARPELRGRHNIIMTEWGPWDHVSPLVRGVSASGRQVVYELFKFAQQPLVRSENPPEVRVQLDKLDGGQADWRLTVATDAAGVFPYTLRIEADGFRQRISGTLVATTWQARFFTWPKELDPREKLEQWRALAGGPGAVAVELGQLRLKYGFGGPSGQKLSEKLDAAGIGPDYFGMIARTRVKLPAGKWELVTLSDDGVRVSIDGQPVIDNWTWHGPTRNAGTYELSAPRTVEIVVEHFEIDGYAVLEFDLRRANDQ